MTTEAKVTFNRYDAGLLKRRTALGTRLKYGRTQSKSFPSGRAARAENIAFPKGLEPVPDLAASAPSATASLPRIDVIAMMDTEAEAMAMADVLTPGVPYTQWHPYAKNFKEVFLPQIGPNGPSREAGCLGSYCVTRVKGLTVLVYKTELHMHEDAKTLPDGSYSLPIRQMFVQMIEDSTPKVFLTTGTSGGVYNDMSLGDVVVSRAARFDCQDDFRDAPFNHRTFQSNWAVPTQYLAAAGQLMHGFANHLTGKSSPRGAPPSASCRCGPATYPTRIYRDGTSGIPEFHPILTTDFFEFGTTVNRLDREGMAVEMDDACLGLACSQLSNPPRWACVRNLSDPVVNGGLGATLQEKCAEYYYSTFGYWTTVMSGLTTWAIIAGL